MADNTEATKVAEPAPPAYPIIVGEDSRSMPSPEGRVDYRVVLVQWDETHIHAYRGIGPRQYVQSSGDPLSLDECKPHFPGIEFKLQQERMIYAEL